MSKAILGVLKSEILEVAGSRQMCAGQDSPCESIVHSLRSLFDSGSVDGLLIVDASNAFNALNRSLALRNILALCPSLGRVLINTYRVDVSLFVGDETIPSREGTTQGDPLAMAMFALATVPLIKNLEEVTEVTQLWYADDASAAGSLSNLKSWWVKLTELGKEFGYLPNAGKTSLLVSIDNYEKACELFQGTGVKVVTDGVTVLGSPIGSPAFVKEHIEAKVEEWVNEVKVLADFAVPHPQAAYCGLSHGLYGRWSYFCRSVLVSDDIVHSLEECIRDVLIPAITGKEAINDTERQWLSLPTRYGGMGIINPKSHSSQQYQDSLAVTDPMIQVLLQGDGQLPAAILMESEKVKKEVLKRKEESHKVLGELVKSELPSEHVRLFEIGNEKGASVWLTALPLREHGFDLHKGAFWDAVCIRYGWRPLISPLLVCVVMPFQLIMLFLVHMVGFIR